MARTSELERTVEREERRWLSFLEVVRLLVVVLDGDGRIIYVNPFVQELTGLPPDKFIGHHVTEFAPANDHLDHAEKFNMIIRREDHAPQRTSTPSSDFPGRVARRSTSSTTPVTVCNLPSSSWSTSRRSLRSW